MDSVVKRVRIASTDDVVATKLAHFGRTSQFLASKESLLARLVGNTEGLIFFPTTSYKLKKQTLEYHVSHNSKQEL